MTLSTPSLTTVTCVLTDGTTFTVSGAIESNSDPRSPLKVISKCRDMSVPYVTELLPRKDGGGKVYYNSRVREAEIKNKDKRERMRRDEEDRVREMGGL